MSPTKNRIEVFFIASFAGNAGSNPVCVPAIFFNLK